ncbi:hypothetical protein M501DRAFT_690692 [Patellaria atrata CBS 101060]|uniref:DUF3074 domain-containing protein n=1 Tax=Patellaria atrata CBS 101060 TaxID=1346257 RepID=A0A9P4SD75_9PEZI|nr:hypothetical protein M501DRAFT_690692 [Patellaria atrata CBS 101060]
MSSDQIYTRLERLQMEEIPRHSSLRTWQRINACEFDTPAEFACAILKEGQKFITQYLRDATGTTKRKTPASDGIITIRSKLYKSSDLPARRDGHTRQDERWTSRSSTHEDKSAFRTASWDEFNAVLFTDRNRNEGRYTPDILEVTEVCNWNDKMPQLEDGLTDISLSLWAMYHKMPTFLSNRRFMVIVATARFSDNMFLTVKVPVEPVHNSTRPCIDGQYVSIEKVERFPDSREIQWDMATASDAGGMLPLWVQRPGIGPAIAKDVGLVMKYLHSFRVDSD